MVALEIAGEHTGMVIAIGPMLRTCRPAQSFCPIISSIIDRRDEIRDSDDRSDLEPLLNSREKSRIGDDDISIQEHAVLTGCFNGNSGFRFPGQ